MKNLFFIVGLCAIAAFALPSSLNAQNSSGNIYPENGAGLNPSNPFDPARATSQGATEYAVAALLRPTGNAAGPTDPKDAKSMVAPSVAPAENDGFSAPTAYSEFKFTQIQDNRPVGFDGPQYNGIAGFDFESFYKTIVGFNFTYSNQNTSTSNGGANLTNSNNAYFFSTYVAKNFDDWVNVGGSFTYGHTDSIFNASIPGASFTQKSAEDSYSYAPFIGVAHTWGAFSFSSTPTYIYSYAHFNFDFPVGDPGFASPAIPDAKTLNQSFLLLNNFQYAINDQWSASIQANWTRLLTMQSVTTLPPAVSPGLPALDHQWMSLGARVDYNFNKDGSVFAAYEHDVFDTHFDDYRIRTGISYNF